MTTVRQPTFVDAPPHGKPGSEAGDHDWTGPHSDIAALPHRGRELINAKEPVASTEWDDCKHELAQACEALAQVAYILNKAEPDDATPDRDSGRQLAGAHVGWEIFWARYGLVPRRNAIGLGKKRPSARRDVECVTGKA